MKTAKILFSLLFIVASMAPMGAMAEDEYSKTRSVSSFNGVEVSTGIQVYLTMGDSQSVRVEASDEVLKEVVTEVKGGVLHIYIKRNNFLNFFNWTGSKNVKVYVTAPEIRKLGASSGAYITSENSLKGNSIDLNASSGAGMKLDLVYKEIDFDCSSGSNVTLQGRSKTFRVSASSGSHINAGKLEAANCIARASSGADIKLVATDEISADSSSGGSISYSGNPSYKNINKSSGGSVSQR